MEENTAGLSSVMAGYLLGSVKALERSGVDAAALLKRYSVTETLTNDPMQRVSTSLLPGFLRDGELAIGDAAFSFRAAAHMTAMDLHVLGIGLLSSGTLMSFCQRLARFMPMLTGSGSVALEPTATGFALVTRPFGPMCVRSEELWLAFIIRIMRQIHSEDFRPVAIRSMHGVSPQRAARFAEYFRAPVTGGHKEAAIEIEKRDALLALQSGNEALANVQDVTALSYLAQLNRGDIVARLQQAIILSLEEDDTVCMDRIARRIGFSGPQQLRTRLAHMQTNYQVVVDQTRAYLARLKLRKTDQSVTEIGHSLGFSDSANFNRAFRRWTGQSPRQFRLRAAGGGRDNRAARKGSE